MSKLVGIGLADLHIGALPMAMHIKELTWLLDYIDKMDTLDFLFIAGDTFDIKEYASSDVFRNVLQFFYRLVEHTRRSKTQIFVIEGTRGHDGLQVGTLKAIFKQMVDYGIEHFDDVHFYVRVDRDTVVIPRTGDKLSILFIPEEYVADQDEYYQGYFDDHYDFIIGHGMTDAVWYGKKKQGKTDHHVSPVFPVSLLNEHANYTFFGHIHQHIEKERFQYIGAYSRCEHGPNDAGFDVIEYDPETGICNPTYIENPNAAKMVTLARSYKEEKLDAAAVVDDIRSMLRDDILETAYKVRLIINFEPSVTNAKAIREYIIGFIDTMPNVSLICKYGDAESNEEESPELEIEEYQSFSERDDFSVQKFIEKNRDVTISLDTIREVMGFEYKEEEENGKPSGSTSEGDCTPAGEGS